jgi:hypothetical protein
MTQPTTDPARISKAQLFRSLGYEPHPGQVLVHRSQAARRVLACGSRWGKTKCAAHEVAAALLEPRERSIGWVVGPTYDLADRVFGLVTEIVESKLKHRVREMSERDKRIVLTNLGGGVSEVRGKSADRPASLLGEGLDWLVVDEAAQLDRDVWDTHLSQRLVDRRGWALLMSTPKGPGWFLRMFRRGQQGKDLSYESWSSPSAANPHLDANAIEVERGRLPDEVFRQEYGGEFVRTHTEPCETCGGPSVHASGVLIIQGEAPIPLCPECDQVVDEKGQTVVALRRGGSVHLDIIREIRPDFWYGAPDELISPETHAADDEARVGQRIRPHVVLTPEEVALAKSGVPMKEWPDAAAAPPEKKPELWSARPPDRSGPITGGWMDDLDE